MFTPELPQCDFDAEEAGNIHVPADQEADCRKAAEECPVDAISIVE